MIDEIIADAEERMGKSVHALEGAFGRIRTGRANPALVSHVMVPYYGTDTPLNQVANVIVEDARTLLISPWEKSMVPEIERAILKSDLGLTPASSGESIRLPMPALTEETRRELQKVARAEAEQARVAIRNIRRDAISDFRELLKEKEITEDEEHGAAERIQKLTDKYVAMVDEALAKKEADLLEI